MHAASDSATAVDRTMAITVDSVPADHGFTFAGILDKGKKWVFN